MSKDFKKEYRELAQKEIPDLWDRIEAGLTEKSTPEIIIVKQRTTTNGNAKGTNFLKKYAGLAAAILCVALIIPASRFIRQSGRKSFSADSTAPQEAYSTANDTAYDTAAIEEASDDAAEEEWGGEVSEAVTEAATEAATEEITEGAAEEMTEGTSKESGAKLREETKEEEMKRGAAADTAAGAEDLGMNLWDMSSANIECPLLTNVVVQVAEKKKDVYREDGSGISGTVYMVIVHEDASGILAEGEQIEVFVPADSSDVMAVKSEMEMDLICESSGEYAYVVNKIYP